MSRPKKSDGATEADADWSILGLPEVLAAIQVTAERLVSTTTAGEADDLAQEALLALSVRPTEVRSSYDQGGAYYVARRAYGFMRTRLMTEVAHQQKYPSLEALTEGQHEGQST